MAILAAENWPDGRPCAPSAHGGERDGEDVVAGVADSAPGGRPLMTLTEEFVLAVLPEQDDALQVQAALLTSRVQAPFEARQARLCVRAGWRRGGSTIALPRVLRDNDPHFLDVRKCLVSLCRRA